MSFKIGEVRIKPRAQSTIETTMTIISVCAATWFTIFSLRAQTYCAIKVEPDTAKPAPSAIIKNVIGKLTDTAATAVPPRRPTQNASVN